MSISHSRILFGMFFHTKILLDFVTGLSCFLLFSKKSKQVILFRNFSVKNASTKKMEYTRTISAEKLRKYQSQVFHFRNFVTEIFAKHFQRFSLFEEKNAKIEFFINHKKKFCKNLSDKLSKMKNLSLLFS